MNNFEKNYMLCMKTLIKKLTLALSVLMFATGAHAGVGHLLPKPKIVEVKSGQKPFSLKGDVVLTDPIDCLLLREFLTGNGCRLSSKGRQVTVEIVDSIPGAFNHQLPEYPDEAYSLSVGPKSIIIKALTPVGVIRATQTLMQMAEGRKDKTLEPVSITDWPAFKLRGFMHDVGRSYITPDELVKEIELFGRFKINTFHWHLTENQAWRFAVDAYPQLTSTESMTRYPGKFYTREDIKRVTDAAAKYGVTVIPEVDMPGHSAAFERAMGFEMQTPQGKEVLKKVLEELAEAFPQSPYLHIGGDEKRITDSTFLPTMTAKVHDLGRKVVCWNPIYGVRITPADGFDMTQMWGTAGKKVSGIPNIDCRYNYTNHFDVFADPVGIYKNSIYYSPQGTPEIAGTISCPWNDRKLPEQKEIVNQNGTIANTLASAERAWMGGGKDYIENGGTTLPLEGEEFEEFADFERRLLFHKDHSLSGEPIPYVRQTDVRWMITDPVALDADSASAFANVREARGAGIYLRHTWGPIIPTFYGKDYGKGLKAYAYTYVYSPKDQDAGALIEFQNYSRSEPDVAPDNGEWDRKGSRVWLNDTELKPAPWVNAGKKITNEVDLANENFSARPPLPVRLKKGWNKVMLKLPYVDTPGIRLNKWMFTFVLTDPDGKHALDGIIYSPTKEKIGK